MGKFKDLTGIKFGRLTVVKRAEDHISPSGKKYIQWHCRCSCSKHNEIDVVTYSLTHGLTKSCGCLAKETSYRHFKKYNKYNLSGKFGVGYTFKKEPFYFDLEDYDKIKDYCWRYNKGNYIVAHDKNKTIFMHRLVMGVSDKKKQVDHIYHITYDNRKSYLRIVSESQNNMNMKIPAHNTSGIKGVSWEKRDQRWIAYIQKNKNVIRKSFMKKEDAITYRRFLEKKYHGEYALKEGAI